jgi:glycosyltransferase involved in cell wall biosynthesis
MIINSKYKIKICIWFNITNNPWGGGNQFLRALSSELTKLGFAISHYPNEGVEIVLMNAHNAGPNIFLRPNQVAQLRQTGRIASYSRFMPQRWWFFFKRRGPVLIHRLDGVAELIRGRRTKADDIQPTINRLADYTIFQSNYCQESFAAYKVRPKHSCVIYNGVDPTIFYPAGDRPRNDRTIRLVGVSWSPNPRKGFASLARISRESDVEVRFIGNWCPDVDSAKVVLLGPKTSLEISEVLRQSDALVHAGENEPCSNVILEGLACGLPILYRDSGGNRELAGDYGVPLTGDPHRNISQLMSDYKVLREKVINDRSLFLITHVARQYLQAFQHSLDLAQE